MRTLIWAAALTLSAGTCFAADPVKGKVHAVANE
jgi:hypothetical protein